VTPTFTPTPSVTLDTPLGGGDYTVFASNFEASAYIDLTFETNGDITVNKSGAGADTTPSVWRNDPGSPGDFWIRAVSVASNTSGNGYIAGLSTDTWYQISSSRTWTVESGAPDGTASLEVTIQISASSGGTILDSANFTISCIGTN